MITIGKHRIRSFMTLEYSFSGIRVIEIDLIPVQWTLTIDLAPSQKKRKNLEEIARKAELTYQRIYFWLETVLTQAVCVNTTNAIGMAIAATSSNVMVMCPDEPYDEVLVELLHSKLTALADGNMLIGSIHLKGSDVTASCSYECPDGLYALPDAVQDYVGIDVTSMHSIPWWARNDGFSFEFLKSEENKDIPDDVYFGAFSDPMQDFDKTMEEIAELAPIIPKEPATIIQAEKWKPRKV